MQATESPDLVRRRGRWISNKDMEIYSQEVSSLLYLPRLPSEHRLQVFASANSFEEVFAFAVCCKKCELAPKAWLFMLQQGVNYAWRCGVNAL